jgi:diguanylate cyclase (GGDEF)-like protein/PAS domain S-box-containing protein
MSEPMFQPWDGDAEQAVAIARVLRRVGAAAGVHIYEMELDADGAYRCRVWIGEAVESLLGPIPPDVDPEAAWEACVHPDDRAAYDTTNQGLHDELPTQLEYRLCGYDGRTRWVWERCRPRRNADGGLLVDGIVNDITERRELQEQLQAAADHDPLTGLPNRAWFQRRLERAVDSARAAASSFGVLFVDLDGFKAVNDGWGHASGDELLVAVGHRLRAEAGGAPVARLGGDEFLLVTAEAATHDEAEDAAALLARRIEGALRMPVIVSGVAHTIRASIGIAVFARDGGTVEELVRSADAAMYQRKRTARRAA